MIHRKGLQEIKKDSRFNEKFQEYVSTWSRLNEPNLKDMLTQLVKIWNRIEDLDITIDNEEVGSKKWMDYNKLLLKMIGQWNLMLTRMGLTFTAQPYIPKEERMKSAKEMIEMNNKLQDFGKRVESSVKKRVNPGGARTWKNGIPLEIVEKKKKEKKKDGK